MYPCSGLLNVVVPFISQRFKNIFQMLLSFSLHKKNKEYKKNKWTWQFTCLLELIEHIRCEINDGSIHSLFEYPLKVRNYVHLAYYFVKFCDFIPFLLDAK